MKVNAEVTRLPGEARAKFRRKKTSAEFLRTGSVYPEGELHVLDHRIAKLRRFQ